MKKINLDVSKKTIEKLSDSISQKNAEIEKSAEIKKNTLDARTEIEGLGLDENTYKVVSDALRDALDRNAAKAKELSNELNKENQELEAEKEQVTEAKESADTARNKLEKNKSILDKLGLGSAMDNGIAETQKSAKEADDINKSILELEKQISDASKKAHTISR